MCVCIAACLLGSRWSDQCIGGYGGCCGHKGLILAHRIRPTTVSPPDWRGKVYERRSFRVNMGREHGCIFITMPMLWSIHAGIFQGSDQGWNIERVVYPLVQRRVVGVVHGGNRQASVGQEALDSLRDV